MKNMFVIDVEQLADILETLELSTDESNISYTEVDPIKTYLEASIRHQIDKKLYWSRARAIEYLPDTFRLDLFSGSNIYLDDEYILEKLNRFEDLVGLEIGKHIPEKTWDMWNLFAFNKQSAYVINDGDYRIYQWSNNLPEIDQIKFKKFSTKTLLKQ